MRRNPPTLDEAKKEDSPYKSYPPSREFRGMDLDVFL
jgi:hypothetical protein